MRSFGIWLAATGGVLLALGSAIGAAATDLKHVSSPCPSREPQHIVSHASGSKAMLVPTGARRVLLCRYSGLNSKAPGSLTAHHLVAKLETTQRLASELDALKPVTGPQACPLDDGSAIIAVFRYAGNGKPDAVTIGLSGCTLVSNGHVHREAGASLVAQLEGLTPVR